MTSAKDNSSGAAGLRPVILFFALAYVISWTAARALHLVARRAGLEDFGSLMGMAETTFNLGSVADRLVLPVPVVWALTRIVDFGPTLAGLIAATFLGGHRELRRLVGKLFRWRVDGVWYALAIVGPAVVMLLAMGLYALLDSSFLASANLAWPATLSALLFWLAVRTFLGGGLGEELGWRGYALSPLTGRYGPAMASFIIGVVWTFWHLPGHLIGASPLANLIGQLLFTVPLSFIATWLYFRAGGSVLVLTLFHGSANGFMAFFERNLFPGLRDADGWLLIFLVLSIGLSAWAASSMRGGDGHESASE
jgi:membrane protease YdiL (CAAX protease family)